MEWFGQYRPVGSAKIGLIGQMTLGKAEYAKGIQLETVLSL